MNVVKFLTESPWLFAIINLELDIGRYPGLISRGLVYNMMSRLAMKVV